MIGYHVLYRCVYFLLVFRCDLIGYLRESDQSCTPPIIQVKLSFDFIVHFASVTFP